MVRVRRTIDGKVPADGEKKGEGGEFQELKRDFCARWQG